MSKPKNPPRISFEEVIGLLLTKAEKDGIDLGFVDREWFPDCVEDLIKRAGFAACSREMVMDAILEAANRQQQDWTRRMKAEAAA